MVGVNFLAAFDKISGKLSAPQFFRSKSIVGIAPLLLDGLGDTIRVSLAEDSANEILFAKKFLKYFEKYKANAKNLP